MLKKGLLLSLAGTIALLSGCGTTTNKSADDPGASAGKATTAQVKPHDPITLVFYYPFPTDWNEEKFMATFGDPIHKKFPYITVKFIVGGTKGNSVPELVAAGQTLDVVAASIGASIANVLDANLQYDITPLAKKHNYDLSKLDPSILEIGKQLANGGLYGLPVYVPPSTVYYNKDLFDKFGVAYPKDGMTWDDMYELDKKLTRNEGGVQYFGFGSSYGHTVLMNQTSIPIVDSKTLKSTFTTDDRWKPFIENFVRMYNVPGYENLKAFSEPNERNQFFKDRTFAMFTALSGLEPADNLKGMNFDFTSYPVFKDKPDIGPQAYPTFFHITTSSKYKDDAFDAIAYLTSDEFQTANSRSGNFVPASPNPAVMKVFGADNPLYQGKNVQAIKPKKYAPPGSINRYYNMAAGKLDVKKIVQTKEDINQALREAQEAADKAIADAEAK